MAIILLSQRVIDGQVGWRDFMALQMRPAVQAKVLRRFFAAVLQQEPDDLHG
jgi:hypothetical protein